MPFRDRVEAGELLGDALAGVDLGPEVLVAGLPRGGVPVAAEVATRLGAPLDVIIVRKVGVPGHRELAMGAVGEGGVVVHDERIMRAVAPSEAAVDRTIAAERAEVEARAHRFRPGREQRSLAGRTVLVVDDGLATGSTAEAAVRVARAQGAARIVVAVPVGSPAAVARLEAVADAVLCLAAPSGFGAVGAYYEDFSETTDDEVVALLLAQASGASPRASRPAATVDVAVDVGPGRLPGTLVVPERASGLVLFAHGSGSSRHSSRNRHVADSLRDAGLATLLFDLLLPEEDGDRRFVFDIDLLAERLLAASEGVRALAEVEGLGVGVFGASTGGGAALVAAARRPDLVDVVVSRGGRPDLAGEHLAHVRAPTRLIVGGADTEVLALNRRAAAHLGCPHDLVVVPGATHLFEEPGALDQVADLSIDWFRQHLPAPR
ncbi:dienelactone hydrolase family protein [Acidimicrobiia bacterium EGI L10123]|uniref:phosphoribosyltransferase family protein n=1 Tax=Salinilacustrithrix flava TaxID=2957203 RepID=UPI003D7C33AA|nr:dienelactone hydrolase family protein [Acidimicrobiia bacterium EGI L10123]